VRAPQYRLPWYPTQAPQPRVISATFLHLCVQFVTQRGGATGAKCWLSAKLAFGED
jgi:hypothetical protein